MSTKRTKCSQVARKANLMLHVFRLQVSENYDRIKITRTETLLQQCTIILTFERKIEFKNMLWNWWYSKRGEEAEKKLPCNCIKLSVALRGQVVKLDKSRLCSEHTAWPHFNSLQNCSRSKLTNIIGFIDDTFTQRLMLINGIYR